MKAEQVTVKGDGLTLSLIIWRKHRRPMPGLVEETLDANPGMAGLGPLLPVGYTFALPLRDETARPVAGVVRLW